MATKAKSYDDDHVTLILTSETGVGVGSIREVTYV